MCLTSRIGPVAQRGLSIVELMVGVAVGLIVVAAASLLMTGQLTENRRLLAETQLQQDLRSATDIITRELRRAGADIEFNSLQTMWFPGKTAAVAENGFSEPLTPAASTSASETRFTYLPFDSGDTLFGFKLEGGAIKTKMLAGGWQELTDPRVLNVTSFVISRDPDTSIQVPCAKRCPDTTAACWPKVIVRNFTVSITASARSMPGVDRSTESKVRVRNERVQFSAPGLVCPT